MSQQNGQTNQGGVQVDPTHVIQSLKRQMADTAARTGEEIAMRDALIDQLGAEITKLRETLDKAATATEKNRSSSRHVAVPDTVDVS